MTLYVVALQPHYLSLRSIRNGAGAYLLAPIAMVVSTSTSHLLTYSLDSYLDQFNIAFLLHLHCLFNINNKYANNYTRDGDDGNWSSFALRVGSSGQIVRVLPSTAGQQTWVVSPQGCPPGRHGTSAASSCNDSRGGLFDATRSSSWQALGNYSLGLEVDLVEEETAPYGLDTIALGFDNSIGGPTLNSQVISALATDDYYMGVFGLGHQATNISNFTDPLPSFLTTMRNESLIPSLSWAYTAGALYRESFSNLASCVYRYQWPILPPLQVSIAHVLPAKVATNSEYCVL